MPWITVARPFTWTRVPRPSWRYGAAYLTGAMNLTQAQLDQAACGTDAKLPPSMTLKPCP
jgi:hypothetical protein